MLSLLYGPTLTSIHDYWKNHSFDYTDLCWQSDVTDIICTYYWWRNWVQIWTQMSPKVWPFWTTPCSSASWCACSASQPALNSESSDWSPTGRHPHGSCLWKRTLTSWHCFCLELGGERPCFAVQELSPYVALSPLSPLSLPWWSTLTTFTILTISHWF